jgi:hypothetical protein
MKLLHVTLFLSVALAYLTGAVTFGDELGVMGAAGLKEITFPGDEYSDYADVEFALNSDTQNRNADIDNLIMAKYKIVNGELQKAKFYLNRIDEKKSRLFAVKKRYLSVIAFIEGDFKQSLEHIKHKRFMDIANYPQICLLKMINYMALDDVNSLRNEKDYCMYYTSKASKNDQYWLDTMVKLKLKDKQGLHRNLITDVEGTLSNDEMSKLWLKTGLYINKESELLKILAVLPENSYQSKRLREIVAFMYLRSGTPGDIAKALSFIDDIETANAENIKGNINLKNKEYELAFGHFRLALQKKQDSMNALERAIPLAWILNQWKDGITMLDNNTNKSLDPRNKSAVRIAFLIREKLFPQAQRELTLLKNEFQNVPPFEVNIMDSYVALMTGDKEKNYDKRKIEESTEHACRSFDGISCWISLQFISWENLGKTIKRDEAIFSDKDMTIDSLKEKKVVLPLKETITVDQRDIEELDSEGIHLMKDVR